MADESEWVKLPADEKCVHKAWKARVAGYEEAAKLFNTLDEKSPEFSKYLGILKKMVTDSNAIAQEKALDAVLAFVENAHVAGKTAGEVSAGIITKCLNASRAKTKEKGMQIMMMYIEIEKQEIIQDELIKGLANKQPKVVVGCIQCLREGLSGYSNKVIQIKPMIKQLQPLLEHREVTVREEAKLFVVEIFRWIGAALKPQLANLKPVQLTELESEFEKLPPGKAQQTKFLRSQQDLKAKMEAQAAAAVDGDAGEEDDAAEEEEAVDPYDLMTPVEIISKLPKDYYDKIEAKKWQERKEALEAVQKLTENPCLEKGDYGDLVRTLKKVISKDTNVMLVTLAAKCINGLASGLRKKFSPYANDCIDAMIEKFREKKITVVTALREAIDTVFLSTSLDAISETCIGYLEHKTPSVKAETAAFLARCISKCTPATLPKKLLKLLVTPLLKAINDSTPDVRDSSFQALGTAMKVVGEKPMMAFLADVDPLKMTKIKECCDKAEVVGQKGKPAAAAAKPAKAPAAETKPAAEKKASRPGTAPPKAAAPAGGAKKKPAPGKGKKSAPASKNTPAATENALSDDAVESKAADILPAECLSNLANSNWKERLAAMETFAQTLKTMESSSIPCQALLRTIVKKPGLKDTNFQVLKVKVDLIGHLAKNSNFSTCTAEFCLNDLVDKIGDVKNGSAVQEALSCIAEACGLEFVSLKVVNAAFSQKNPKNQAESLNWLSGAIKEFGFKVNVKPIVDNVKTGLSATNPAVRSAAISVLSAMYLHMGAPLRMLFDGEKQALLTQIDAEFDKLQGQKPPAPTRGLKSAQGEQEEENEEDEDEVDEVNVADLVPRTDISAQLTEDLMTELADKNWKIRNEALQKVVGILKEAKFITPALGPLPESLKLRLADSNKILVTTTLNICLTLATAVGPKIKQHVRIMGLGIVMCMGDSKPQVRKTVRECLDAWVEQGGLPPFVEAEVFSEALAKENPNLRAELLSWLAEKLPKVKKLPKDEISLCIPHILRCLEDRNADVRKSAQEAIMPFMIHTGYEAMAKKASKLKPASKELLDKARAELPAKPTKPAKSKPAAAASSAPVVDEEDDEPARPATAPAKAPAKGKAVKGGKKPVRGGGVAAAPSKKKGQEEEDTSPPLKVSNGKEQRFKEEKQLKALKWNFTAPRGEFLEQLRSQMEPTLSKTLVDQLFHADFKNHIKAIDTLHKCLESLPDATIANLDLLLKWLTLRFFDTNTTVLMKCLEYCLALFNLLSDNDYHMHDLEASAFIPYLVNKVGDPKDNIRKNVRAILRSICKVFPSSKMFSYLIDGLKSKNARQRTECLEELGSLIELYGINVCQPSPAQALKLIAQQISDRDNSVRSSALNTIVVAYFILGEVTYKYIGNLSDKDAGMLEERIKRSSKQRPPSAVLQPQTQNKMPEEKPAPKKGRRSVVPEEAPRRPPPQAKKFLDIDDDEPSNYDLPNLIQIDVTDVLGASVALPTAKAKRPGGATVKMLSLSNDVNLSLDMVISHIGSPDIQTSLESLNQVDELLKSEEKRDVLLPHVDQLLVVFAMQLRVTHSKHMGDSNTERDSIIALYKNIMGVILALLACPSLAKAASPDVLKDLILNLITVLLDSRLVSLEEGPQVARTVNVLIGKVMTTCDPTSTMSALIRLLRQSLDSEATSVKFLEVIMKCIWRAVRYLPDVIDDMDLDPVIGDLHEFLVQFPSSSWKKRSSDTPLRTIKTILHNLARLKGQSIMNHLSQVTMPCEVEAYLRKVLDGSASNGSSNGDVSLRSGKKDKSKRISKGMHDLLVDVFKKIGSKENTRDGLNDLYDFKTKYPQTDIEPFLMKCSEYFRDYIERGLKNIEAERKAPARSFSSSTPNIPTSDGSATLTTLTAVDDNMDPTALFERLKFLRAQCGLDNASMGKDSPDKKGPVSQLQDAGSNSSLSSTTSSNGMPNLNVISIEETAMQNSASSNISQQKYADIRKRLERIKNRQT